MTAVAAGTTGEGPWGATPRLFQTTLKDFAADLPVLAKERFGPAGLMISYPSVDDLVPVLAALDMEAEDEHSGAGRAPVGTGHGVAA